LVSQKRTFLGLFCFLPYSRPLPSWVITAAGRVVAAIVETAVVVAAMELATDLVVGGLTLVWKRIEVINELLFLGLFLFGGMLLPFDRTPTWVAAIARLVPITHAAQALRNVLLDGRPVATVRGDGGLAWLSATTVAWLLGGALAFHLGEQTAKRQGSLSRS
jgi:ABC-2 type transport system permease protein